MRNQRALFHHIGPSRKQEPIGENLTDRTFARARLRNKETGVQLLVNSDLPEGSLLHVTSVYRKQCDDESQTSGGDAFSALAVIQRVCVCVCARARACVRVCVFVCVCVSE